MNSKTKILMFDQVDLRTQSDYEALAQAEAVAEELVAALAQSMASCFEEADASVTRVERSLDEALYALLAEDSERWTN